MLALITYPSAIEDRCRTFKPFYIQDGEKTSMWQQL